MHSELRYGDECGMPFSDFISKVKEMFDIYYEGIRAFTETRKLRFLLESIDSPAIQPAIESLKAQLAVDPDSWTFVSAANHLAAQISPVPKVHEQSTVPQGDVPSVKKRYSKDEGDAVPLYKKRYTDEEWALLSAEEISQIRASLPPGKWARRGCRPPRKNDTIIAHQSQKRAEEITRESKELRKELTREWKERSILALSGKKRTYPGDDNPTVSTNISGGDSLASQISFVPKGGESSMDRKRDAVPLYKKKRYSDEEWSLLSPEERSQIFASLPPGKWARRSGGPPGKKETVLAQQHQKQAEAITRLKELRKADSAFYSKKRTHPDDDHPTASTNISGGDDRKNK